MVNNMELSLKNREWKEFDIDLIFNVSGTVTTHPSKLIKGGNVPRITCAATNNGFENTYKNKPTEKGGVITIDSATIGYVSYQPFDFIATDHVEKISLKNNEKINKYLGNFIVFAIMNATKKKYGYGYKFSQSRIKRQKILLPVNSKGDPDYEFMENYMRAKEQEKTNVYKNYISKRISELEDTKEVVPLSEKDWAEFEISKIFKLKAGKRLTKADMKKGKKPFIGATEYNNGITEYISNTNISEDCNVLGVNYNGSVVENFYHPYTALFSDDVKRLSYKDVEGNKHLYLFAKTQILKQKSKYQYGYKFNGTRMNKQKIMLPINDNHEPDYEYMENYMKQLELKKLKKYLKYKNV